MEESIAKQKASVQKQAGAAPAGGFFTSEWGSRLPVTIVPPQFDCPPLTESEIDPLIAVAATAQHVKPELLRAVIRVESAFRPCAVSSHGAMGLMQIMPDTAEQLHLTDAFDPASNVNAGAQYLKQMLDRFKGDTKLALAAYNAGPTRVDGATPSVPDIAETQNYVTQIMKELEPVKPK